MNIKTAKRVAPYAAGGAAILFAAAAVTNIVLSVQELNRSGSQDALIGAVTWAGGIAAAYGMYRMNRVAASALLAFSMWMVVVAVAHEHIGTVGILGVATFAVLIGCGTAGAWLRPQRAA